MASGGEPRRPCPHVWRKLAAPLKAACWPPLHQRGKASCSHPHPTSDPLFVRFHQLRAIPSLPSPNLARNNRTSEQTHHRRRTNLHIEGFSTFPCVFARQVGADPERAVFRSSRCRTKRHALSHHLPATKRLLRR